MEVSASPCSFVCLSLECDDEGVACRVIGSALLEKRLGRRGRRGADRLSGTDTSSGLISLAYLISRLRCPKLC